LNKMPHLFLIVLMAIPIFAQMHGPTYQKKSGAMKLNELWTAMEQNKQGLPWYGAVQMAELFIGMSAPQLFLADTNRRHERHLRFSP
jgi:hypothetical protein